MAVIAIDVQGGDYGPSQLLPSLSAFFTAHPSHKALVFGQAEQCKPYLQGLPDNVRFVGTEYLLPDNINPAQLIRRRYHSSLESAYGCIAADEADVLVSAEHTGLMIALLHRHAVTHPAIERPVLVTWVPTVLKPLVMLDLGASFSASAEQLLGFAAIGQAIVAQSQKSLPRLAILNMGVEANKGPQALRLAAAELALWPDIEYCGFVEANDVFNGHLDLVVTDGFTGNAVIKAAEGTLDLTLNSIRDVLTLSWTGRILGRLLKSKLKPKLASLDPRQHNGALLAGTELTVIKSHGHADHKAFQAALSKAVEAAEGRWCQRIQHRLDLVL